MYVQMCMLSLWSALTLNWSSSRLLNGTASEVSELDHLFIWALILCVDLTLWLPV
jgi:hypothetical protein